VGRDVEKLNCRRMRVSSEVVILEFCLVGCTKPVLQALKNGAAVTELVEEY
jgi:hypothetical protein